MTSNTLRFLRLWSCSGQIKVSVFALIANITLIIVIALAATFTLSIAWTFAFSTAYFRSISAQKEIFVNEWPFPEHTSLFRPVGHSSQFGPNWLSFGQQALALSTQISSIKSKPFVSGADLNHFSISSSYFSIKLLHEKLSGLSN